MEEPGGWAGNPMTWARQVTGVAWPTTGGTGLTTARAGLALSGV